MSVCISCSIVLASDLEAVSHFVLTRTVDAGWIAQTTLTKGSAFFRLSGNKTKAASV